VSDNGEVAYREHMRVRNNAVKTTAPPRGRYARNSVPEDSLFMALGWSRASPWTFRGGPSKMWFAPRAAALAGRRRRGGAEVGGSPS